MTGYRYATKQEADHLIKLEISWLKKNGYLDGFKNGIVQWEYGWIERTDKIGVLGNTIQNPGYMEFSYSQTDLATEEKVEFNYQVELTTTDCNLGGYRYWFICPLTKDAIPCGRRVGVLYKGGDYFGCRHCYKLTYASRNRSRNPFFKVLDIGGRVDKIYETMTTPFYNGKPTKKFQRIEKLYNKRGNYTPLLNLDKDI